MSRAVTGDHILFAECLPAFRPEIAGKWPATSISGDASYEYILFDFDLQETIDFVDFRIEPTRQIDMPGVYRAYIAPITIPTWFKDHNRHLFSLAASAVLSFSIGRPVNSTRDSARLVGLSATGTDWLAVAQRMPVLCAGPGAHSTRVATKRLDEMFKYAIWLTSTLRDIPYEDYVEIMRAIRLVQLSHLTVREDFALGYYLLVSAIEAVAQKAISKKDVSEPHPSENTWKKLARQNPEVRLLWETYKEALSGNGYLKKRFIKFVTRYAPKGTWQELPDPRDLDWISENTGRNWSFQHTKSFWEVWPEDLSDDDVDRILSDAYNHRSKFTHKGDSPPHQHPSSVYRFFEQVHEFNGNHREIVVPTYQLMDFIANRSITEYLKSEYS